MSIYIEEAEIVSVGTKWDKGKSKKKQVKSHFYTDDGIKSVNLYLTSKKD